MKKFLIFSALVAQSGAFALAPSSCPEVTSKFFIELQGGCTTPYIGKPFVNSLEGTAGSLAPVQIKPLYQYYPGTVGATWGSPGLTALLNLGYDCKLRNSNIVIGAFLGGGVSKTSAQLSVLAESALGGAVAPSAPLFNAPFYLSTSGRFQAGFRLGAVALGAILPVFTIGWSTFSSKVRVPRISSILAADGSFNNVNVAPSVSKWINCLMLGFGLEFNLSPGLILGFTSNVHIGSTPKYDFTKFTNLTLANGKPDKLVLGAHPVLVEMLATIKYAMPTCR